MTRPRAFQRLLFELECENDRWNAGGGFVRGARTLYWLSQYSAQTRIPEYDLCLLTSASKCRNHRVKPVNRIAATQRLLRKWLRNDKDSRYILVSREQEYTLTAQNLGRLIIESIMSSVEISYDIRINARHKNNEHKVTKCG